MADIHIYATADDLVPRWLPVAPADAEQQLMTASVWVAAACLLDPYEAPTADQAGPLRDATCAQVASWAAAGVTPGQPPAAVLQRRELDQARIWYDSAAATAFTTRALTELADIARALLTAAGLIVEPGVVFTAGDVLPSYGLSAMDIGYPPTQQQGWWR